MSVEAMAIALMQPITGDPGAKIVLLGLANHADRYGRAAFPSQATLSEYAGVSLATVKRKLAWLEEQGYITRGDQQLVSHIRGDRRPIVYDVRMAVSVPTTAQDELPSTAAQSEPRLKSAPHGSSPVSYKPSLEPSLKEPSLRSGKKADDEKPTNRNGCRLPADWHPEPADMAWFADQGHSRQFGKIETDKFRDYWVGIPGARGRKLDWSATWRNWIRKAADDANRRGGTRSITPGQATAPTLTPPPVRDVFAELDAKIARENAAREAM